MTAFFFGTTVSTLVNATILALVSVALTISLWKGLQLQRERVALKQASRDLRRRPAGTSETDEEDSEGAQESSPRDRDELVQELRRGLDQRSIILQRVDDLEQIGTRSSIDVAGLTALSREALRDALSFPTALGPALVLMGLLGTLWGLGVAVTQLTVTLSSSVFSTEQLKTAILGTLGGMQTAFSTTLMGIMGTLVLRAATGAVRKGQSAFLRDLERLLVTRLVPLYEVSEKSALPRAAEELKSINTRLNEQFKTLVTEVSSKGEGLAALLQKRFLAMEENFNKRAAALLKETGRAMDAVLTMLGERREGAPSLAEYVDTVRETTGELARSVDIASAMVPEMEDRLQTVIRHHASSLEEALAAHTDRVAPILEDQRRASAALAETAEASATSMSGLQEQLAAMTSSFEAARGSWERVDHMVARLGAACSESIAEGLHEFVQELKSERKATDVERERIAAAIQGLQSSLAATLDRLHEDRTAAQKRSIEVLETTQNVMTKGLERIVGSMQSRQEAHVESFLKGLRELGQEIRDLSLSPGDNGLNIDEQELTSWDLPDRTSPAVDS